MKLLALALILFLTGCRGCLPGADMVMAGDAGNYYTYAGARATIERQNELGQMDTITVDSVVSMTIYPTYRMLRMGKGKVYMIPEPNQKLLSLEE